MSQPVYPSFDRSDLYDELLVFDFTRVRNANLRDALYYLKELYLCMMTDGLIPPLKRDLQQAIRHVKDCQRYSRQHVESIPRYSYFEEVIFRAELVFLTPPTQKRMYRNRFPHSEI